MDNPLERHPTEIRLSRRASGLQLARSRPVHRRQATRLRLGTMQLEIAEADRQDAQRLLQRTLPLQRLAPRPHHPAPGVAPNALVLFDTMRTHVCA